jgi:hypothetical protein
MHPIDDSLVGSWILRALEGWSNGSMVVVSQDAVRRRAFGPVASTNASRG